MTYYSQQVGVACNCINLLGLRSRLTPASKSIVAFSKLDVVPECHRLQEDSLYLGRMPDSHQCAGRQKVMGIGVGRPLCDGVSAQHHHSSPQTAGRNWKHTKSGMKFCIPSQVCKTHPTSLAGMPQTVRQVSM